MSDANPKCCDRDLPRKISDCDEIKELHDLDDETNATIREKDNEMRAKESIALRENSPKEKENATLDFDKLLQHAGELGRYQIFLMFATLPFYVNGLFVDFNQLFMTEVASHWCWIPELANLSREDRVALAIPPDDIARHGFSMCSCYKANWAQVLSTGLHEDVNLSTTACENGWEFNSTEMPYPTISSDFAWVCDRRSYQAIAQSLFFCGSVIGTLLFGLIADAYGRLAVIVASNAIGCIGGVASSFAQNFIQFAGLRFLTGMSYDNCMMMTNLLLLEYVAANQRTLLSNFSFGVFYGVAAVALPWIALACSHWRTLGLVTSLPMAVGLLAPFIFLESPRWLLVQRKIEDAIEKVLMISRVNKRKIPQHVLDQFRSSEARRSEEKGTFLDLIRRPKLRWLFFILCIVFMCESISFDALARIGGELDMDFFVSFSLQALTECPSMLLIAFVMDWSGRRILCSLSMLIGALSCFIAVFGSGGWTSLLGALIGRFFVNVAYTASMQWTAELLPTPVRGIGNGVVHIFGALGTVISPYVVYLETVRSWGPFAIVSVTAAIGSFLACLLPETTHKDMPQTFEDSENLIADHQMWSAPFWSKHYCEKETCETYL